VRQAQRVHRGRKQQGVGLEMALGGGNDSNAEDSGQQKAAAGPTVAKSSANGGSPAFVASALPGSMEVHSSAGEAAAEKSILQII
jgi:hypothetical protein